MSVERVLNLRQESQKGRRGASSRKTNDGAFVSGIGYHRGTVTQRVGWVAPHPIVPLCVCVCARARAQLLDGADGYPNMSHK